MKKWRSFLTDQTGGPAAEFAMVLPVALLFLFGMIDVGRYMWEMNRAEKATQIGARWAVATDVIANDLADYSFAVDGGIPQGDLIPASSFPGVSCTSDGCTCKVDAGCDFGLDADSDAFDALVDRMNNIKSDIGPENVTIDYNYSGLGFAGDPNGVDVAPLVTVSLVNMTFQPFTFMLFSSDIGLPSASYSLTMEDGQGNWSN